MTKAYLQSGLPQTPQTNPQNKRKHRPKIHKTSSSSASIKHHPLHKTLKTNSLTSATSHGSTQSKESSAKIPKTGVRFKSALKPRSHEETKENNHDKLIEARFAAKRSFPDLIKSFNLSISDTKVKKIHNFGGFNLKQVGYSCLVLALVFGTLLGVLLYYYVGSGTLYSVDYTLCPKVDSNITCQSVVDSQMNVNSPISQPCTCRLSFELEDTQDVEQINVYYGLDRFYQNYRFLAHSSDAYQMSGKSLEPRNHKVCRPLVNNKTTVPCGGLANVIFDDEFSLSTSNMSFSMDRYNIPLERSRGYQYGNPLDLQGSRNYSKPPRWTSEILNLDNGTQNNGFENGPFIVWMTPSVFGDFVKLYSIIRPRGGLSKGQYNLEILYKYGIFSAGGRKFVHIESVGAQGLRNSRLLITLSIMTFIYLIIVIITSLVWWRWAYRGQGLFLLL